MKKRYVLEVNSALSEVKNISPGLLLESNMEHLPEIVKKYLRFAGAVGKEKVFNFRVLFSGGIRSKPEDGWMKLKSEQYNFIANPKRIFYITAHKMGLPASGIHLYKNEKAIMHIKLFGLFTIVDAKGIEMDQGETVTLFNDMCFMAPATLIDRNIEWEVIDPLTVNASYTNGSIKISAQLFFNEEGALMNFISNDRFETADGKIYKNYPWSTPVSGYYESAGRRLPVSAKAVYHKPGEDFCYGEFKIEKIEYNLREMK